MNGYDENVGRPLVGLQGSHIENVKAPHKSSIPKKGDPQGASLLFQQNDQKTSTTFMLLPLRGT